MSLQSNINKENNNNNVKFTNFFRNRVTRFGRFGLSKKYQQALITPLSDEQRKMVIEKLRKKGLQPQPGWMMLKNELSKKSEEPDRKKVTFEKKSRRDSVCFDPTPRFIEELLSSAPSSPTMSDRPAIPPPRTTSKSRPSTLQIDIHDPYISDVSLSAPSSPNNDIATYYDTIPLLPECRDSTTEHFFHPANVPFRTFFPFSTTDSLEFVQSDLNQSNLNDSTNQFSSSTKRFVIGSEEPSTTLNFTEPLPPLPTNNISTSPFIIPYQPIIHTSSIANQNDSSLNNRPISSKVQTLTQIMEKLQIKHLTPTFQIHGIDTLQSFTKITEKTLDKMQIDSTELRTKIMTAINLLSDDIEDIPSSEDKDINVQNEIHENKSNIDHSEKTNSNHIREQSSESRRRTHSVNKQHRDSKRADKKSVCSNHQSPHRSSTSITPRKTSITSLATGSKPIAPLTQVSSSSLNTPRSHSSHKSLRASHHHQYHHNQHPTQHPTPTPFFNQLEPMIIHQHIHHHHHVNSVLPTSSSTTRTNIPSTQTTTIPQITWNNNDITKKLVDQKLHLDSIKLSEQPYSDKNGNSGIPLRLIERYAYDLEKDIRDVAIAMETIRMDKLLDQGRNANSCMDIILSDQFLNCDGIKTDSLETFFISIGLPMYSHVPCHNLSTLLLYSDESLTSRFGIAPQHVRWIRREASFLPTGFLHHNHYRYTTNRSESFTTTPSNPAASKFYAADRV